MPSEITALHRELDDSFTPEQIEEQEENFYMCKAEEEDAYNEILELDELKEKDQDAEMLEFFLNSEEIQFQYDENFIAEIKLRELLSKAGIRIPSYQLSSPVKFNTTLI